jgi:hypothetical protein
VKGLVWVAGQRQLHSITPVSALRHTHNVGSHEMFSSKPTTHWTQETEGWVYIKLCIFPIYCNL